MQFLNRLLTKYAASRFMLSEQSIAKIVHHFPKIKRDVIDLISDCMDRDLYREERLPGMKKEHLGTTGLCGIIAGNIMELIKKYYTVNYKQGFYKLDKHPRFKDQKICSYHTWLEVDGKILDFTARQFQPFVDEQIDEVVITDPSNSRYMKFPLPEGYKDVGLDDEYVLDWYIGQL